MKISIVPAPMQEKRRKGKKKSGDRCTRIAKRKYKVWPSAYASGAVVRCRKGKIWKGIKEGQEEAEKAILDTLEYEGGAAGLDPLEKAIEDIDIPEDFDIEEFLKDMEDVIQHEAGDYVEKTGLDEKKDFSLEKKKGLHGWFSRQGAKGKTGGWIDCKTGKPCGRQPGEKRGKPRCRPTKAQCKGYKRPDERGKTNEAVSDYIKVKVAKK